MNFVLATNQLDTINNTLHYLDIIMVVLAIGIGIFTIIKPRKAWVLFQSKKYKKDVPTDKTIKTTRIFGIAILILAVAFIFVLINQ